nr:Retrotransposon gag protein [Ipomoea batatas]
MQGRRSLKPTLLPLDDNIDKKKKKKKPLPFENPNPKPQETTTTMDALPQPPQPNPQPNPRLMKDFGRPQMNVDSRHDLVVLLPPARSKGDAAAAKMVDSLDGTPSSSTVVRGCGGSRSSARSLAEEDGARNYELKTVHYNQLPSFHGSASEDALTFIRDFYGIIQHFPLMNDLTEDALRMRCFPYTLKDAAKIWFMSLTPGSLRTWPEVYNKFIGKFYSHAKTAELRRKIATFSQAEGEPFHEAWERFKMLLIQCPHHGYPLELQNQTFYDGLTQVSQSMVDNAAGGAMGENTAEETLTLYEMLGANSQQKRDPPPIPLLPLPSFHAERRPFLLDAERKRLREGKMRPGLECRGCLEKPLPVSHESPLKVEADEEEPNQSPI